MPVSARARHESGYCSQNRPVRKNVARMWRGCNSARIARTAESSEPASNVSATLWGAKRAYSNSLGEGFSAASGDSAADGAAAGAAGAIMGRRGATGLIDATGAAVSVTARQQRERGQDDPKAKSTATAEDVYIYLLTVRSYKNGNYAGIKQRSR